MNLKLTFSDLVALLALRSGKSKKMCEEFLKEFFGQIAGALEDGENVRIKGFGTFKVSRVEARKSVNVTTGQEFEIPAHNRISFVAAKELAAAVNAPFEMFEAVELADGLTENELDKDPSEMDSTVRAEEIEVIQSEIEAETEIEPDPEAEREVEEMENEIEDENIDSEFPQPILEAEEENTDYSAPEQKPIQESITESNPEASPEHAQEPLHEPALSIPPHAADVPAAVSAPQPAPVESPDVMAATLPALKKDSDEGRHRRKMIWVFVAGFVAAALIAVIVGLSVAYCSLSKRIERAEEPVVAHTQDVDIVEDENVMTENETVPVAAALAEASETEVVAPVEQKKEVSASEKPKAKEDVAATKPSDSYTYDRISNTRFLTTMAKHYYGNYEFWPYIYEANPNLGHPDRIKPGTRIKIPPLSSIGANPSNPSDIAAAKRKGAAIYARYNTPMGASTVKKSSSSRVKK